MRQEHLISLADLDERTRQAVADGQSAIAARYPTARFALTPSPEDPASLHLLAVADVDDPDEIGDLVVEQLVALHVDADISLHVIPLRTREHVQTALMADRPAISQRLVRKMRR